MPDIGKAYVQIIPKAEGISEKISSSLGGGAQSAGESTGKSIGTSLVSSLKGIIVAAGIGTMIKESLEAGGNLQQSFGGLETIYGEAAEGAKKYAYEAQKAGISANDYAEQAVSFGASLKQAFEGDTTQAVEAANTAIMDMTDNAAKMGTPIESIQNAYQGFAKQNYTMLDNLKLGYGGTKSEMERLLADAQELSGVEYNIDNLGDVYEAIHVIQEDLGLTGVAAAEAEGTFTGSMDAMKAAAENLMANLALGQDITEPLAQLMDSAQAFILGNLAPMIGNIAAALPDLVSGLGTFIITGLNIAANNADAIVQQGIEIVSQLALAIVEAVPYIADAALNLVVALGQAFVNTDWATVGNNIMNSLKNSLSLAAGEILGADTSTIKGFMDGITRSLPQVLQTGVEIITNVVNGILQAYPQILTVAGNIVTQFAGFILQNAPTVLTAGANLLVNLITGIANNLPQIVSTAMDVVLNFARTILDNLPQILQAGVEIIIKLAAGVISAIPQIILAMAEICLKIVDAVTSYDWLSLGLNILEGIGQGIVNGTETLVSVLWGSVSKAIEWVMSKLGIKSPSKYMADNVGKNMALGIGEGFEDNMPTAEIETAIMSTVNAAETAAGSGLQSQTPAQAIFDYSAIYEAVKEGAEAAHLAILLDGRELTRTLKGLGVSMA